jgi:hypothetical protein
VQISYNVLDREIEERILPWPRAEIGLIAPGRFGEAIIAASSTPRRAVGRGDRLRELGPDPQVHRAAPGGDGTSLRRAA